MGLASSVASRSAVLCLGTGYLPKSLDHQWGLATMRSGPAAQGALLTTGSGRPRVWPLNWWGLLQPIPPSALPLFLPPELGGPWGLTSLHRKRNHSRHPLLHVTSPVTWPSFPGASAAT